MWTLEIQLLMNNSLLAHKAAITHSYKLRWQLKIPLVATGFDQIRDMLSK